MPAVAPLTRAFRRIIAPGPDRFSAIRMRQSSRIGLTRFHFHPSILPALAHWVATNLRDESRDSVSIGRFV